jgi:hypothetical protein
MLYSMCICILNSAPFGGFRIKFKSCYCPIVEVQLVPRWENSTIKLQKGRVAPCEVKSLKCDVHNGSGTGPELSKKLLRIHCTFEKFPCELCTSTEIERFLLKLGCIVLKLITMATFAVCSNNKEKGTYSYSCYWPYCVKKYRKLKKMLTCP